MDPRFTILEKTKLELQKSLEPIIEEEKEEELVGETQGGAAWERVKKGFERTTHRSMSNFFRIPTLLNEMKATALMTNKELEILNNLPPDKRELFVNLYGTSPTWGQFSQYLLGLRDEALNHFDRLNEEIYKFETTHTEDFKEALKDKDFGALWDASVRTSVTFLEQLPFLLEAITLPGIAAIVFQEAAGASGEKQEEAWEAYKAMLSVIDPDYHIKKEKLLEIAKRGDINKNLMGYSTMVGFSEGLLELTTRGIARGMFKNLLGIGKGTAVKSLKQWGLTIIKSAGGEGLSEGATEKESMIYLKLIIPIILIIN